MAETVLLTGATGFVGMEVLARLLARPDTRVVALVRARDRAAASERIAGVLSRLYDTPPAEAAARITALPADLALPGAGLSARDRREAVGRTDAIIHCAASISFDLPLAEAMQINAGGTQRVLELAHEIGARHGLRRIVHVSTAYVAGRHAGLFAEDDLDVGQTFRNSYEHSKFKAEQLLRRLPADVPLVTLRPSIVVGDSASGWTPAFNVVYWPLRAFARGLLASVPADPRGLCDIVPGDYVADAILAVHDDASATGTLHLTAGLDAIKNSELIRLASGILDRPAPRLDPDGMRHLPEAELYMPYLDVRTVFSNRRATEALAPHGLAPPPVAAYLDTLMGYAQRSQWGKRPLTREGAARVGALDGGASGADGPIPRAAASAA